MWPRVAPRAAPQASSASHSARPAPCCGPPEPPTGPPSGCRPGVGDRGPRRRGIGGVPKPARRRRPRSIRRGGFDAGIAAASPRPGGPTAGPTGRPVAVCTLRTSIRLRVLTRISKPQQAIGDRQSGDQVAPAVPVDDRRYRRLISRNINWHSGISAMRNAVPQRAQQPAVQPVLLHPRPGQRGGML